MKVERIHNEAIHPAAHAEKIVKSLKKTETTNAVDPERGDLYQRKEENQHASSDTEGENLPQSGPPSSPPKAETPSKLNIDVLA
jgi:hypothetical protein